ncbi:MAG: SRPBCC family protein [Bacteroidota bacterium]|nr:SRPBCC family protein [Bacteroidota bacterium]
MIISESISISQNPDKIWDFWLPVTTDVLWRDGVIKAELSSQPPSGVGSTGVHYIKALGPMPWTIIKWEDGRHMEWIFGECRLKGFKGFYHVEPENKGSRVTMQQTQPALPLFMRILMGFMRGIIRKGMKGDLQSLKAVMEN